MPGKNYTILLQPDDPRPDDECNLVRAGGNVYRFARLASPPGLHLVLDLDETLISGTSLNTSVARPYLRPFLDFCFAEFGSVSVWTSASKEWLDLNLKLHMQGYPFRLTWSGERCSHQWDYEVSHHRDPVYRPYKPLKKMWRLAESRDIGMTPETTIIVDDDPFSGIKNRGNLIVAPPFSGSSEDKYLLDLMKILWGVRLLRPTSVRGLLPKT